MSVASGNFTFGDGYILMPANGTDFVLAKRWTEKDRAHQSLNPRFWIVQQPGVTCYLLYDGQGAVFFFRIQLTNQPRQLKIFIQFAPSGEVSPRRTSRALMEGFAWFEPFAAQCGFNNLVTDSENATLVAFLTRRLGFKADDGTNILMKVI